MLSFVDPRTLILVIGLVLLCRALVLLYVWLVQRKYPPARDWAIGTLACAFGGLLAGLRGLIPAWISVVMAHAFLIPGMMLIDCGIIRAAEVKPPWRTGLVISGLATAVIAWFFWVDPDYGSRIVVFTAAVVLFDLYTALVCLGNAQGSRVATFRILALLLLALSASNIWKTSHILTEGIESILSSSPANVQFYLVVTAYAMITTSLCVLLTAQKLQEELDSQARRDTLTKAFNRRAMNEFCEREWSRSTRHTYPLSFLMADIDHFKRFNDDYGHAVGDLALAAVSRTAEQALRPEDIWCRYGGEEFVALLPHTGGEQAKAVAERLRAALEEMTIEAPQGPIRLTVSIGVVERSMEHQDWNEAVEHADRALYKAKSSGRNCVVLGE